jgi:transmembrane secretion effector
MHAGPSAQTEVGGPPAHSAPSGWSPLRYGAFRGWWLANLTSNVGSWMQTVAAQWLMTSLTSSALLVGAIQATNLPVLVLAIPAGVLGDLLDRKRLIIAGQSVMLISALVLAGLDAAGAVTPIVLLILLCGIGIGQGLTDRSRRRCSPSWCRRPSGHRRSRSARSIRTSRERSDRRSAACCSRRRARRSCSSSTRSRFLP